MLLALAVAGGHAAEDASCASGARCQEDASLLQLGRQADPSEAERMQGGKPDRPEEHDEVKTVKAERVPDVQASGAVESAELWRVSVSDNGPGFGDLDELDDDISKLLSTSKVSLPPTDDDVDDDDGAAIARESRCLPCEEQRHGCRGDRDARGRLAAAGSLSA